MCCRIVVVADEDSGAGTHARWLTALLREGRDATAVAGEDGDGAVLQKLRFVSGVVVFVVAAVAVQTVEARSRVAVLLMVAELVQPWLLREVQRT